MILKGNISMMPVFLMIIIHSIRTLTHLLYYDTDALQFY